MLSWWPQRNSKLLPQRKVAVGTGQLVPLRTATQGAVHSLLKMQLSTALYILENGQEYRFYMFSPYTKNMEGNTLLISLI
jgi:hypothetical protein